MPDKKARWKALVYLKLLKAWREGAGFEAVGVGVRGLLLGGGYSAWAKSCDPASLRSDGMSLGSSCELRFHFTSFRRGLPRSRKSNLALPFGQVSNIL